MKIFRSPLCADVLICVHDPSASFLRPATSRLAIIFECIKL